MFTIIDPPYLGTCVGQYSKLPADIANMDEADWTNAMHQIARNCAAARTARCTVIIPKWINTDRVRTVLCPEIVREAWRAAGYRLRDVCYASKRIQSARTHRIAFLNNAATRLPLCDISEVLTFDLAT